MNNVIQKWPERYYPTLLVASAANVPVKRAYVNNVNRHV